MEETVMHLANVSREKAEEALAKHKEVWRAVDALMDRPVVSGEKYIPRKPIVHTGLTSEQEARCRKGRWLQNQINAVFSVAHSKSPLVPPVLEDALSEQSSHVPESEVVIPVAQMDVLEKTLPQVEQSEQPR